jgi:hypothetical protein
VVTNFLKIGTIHTKSDNVQTKIDTVHLISNKKIELSQIRFFLIHPIFKDWSWISPVSHDDQEASPLLPMLHALSFRHGGLFWKPYTV